MTQLQQAKAGVITPQMQRVAERENVAPELVREEIATGRLVIPANRIHLAGGDGKAALALIDTETGKFASSASKTTALGDVVCDPKICPLYEKKQCHRIMNLQFIIPKVKALGVWQLDTGSVNSIININSSLDLIKSITGRISMIPMKLVVEPQDAQVEGKKKTIHVLQLVVERSFTELVELPNLPRATVLLPSSDAEVPDDLYPDGVVASDPEDAPAQLSDRPQPKQRRRRSTALVAQPEEPPKPTDGPPSYSQEFGSVLPQTQAKVNAYMKADATGLTATKVLHKKGWDLKNTGELSEYQAQVVIAVCEGRDEKDVVAA